MILLDITFTTSWVIGISIVIVFIIIALVSTSNSLSKEQFKSKHQELITKNREAELKVYEAELKVQYQQWAIAELEKFKQSEILSIKKVEQDNAIHTARVLLQEWKIESEAKIRQDAINRSYSVNLGKITEHLVPFHATFLSQFNPKDARFIGSPIDLIVFDGYSDKRDDIIIYLVEIKTGNSKLTEVQKKIKEAVRKYEIRWAEINPDNPNSTEILASDLANNKKTL